MSNIESLLAHRIKQSSALIARVRPLVESAAAAARKREIGDPVVVLADSMRWRRRLIVALAELNESSDRMALTDRRPLHPANGKCCPPCRRTCPT